MTNRKGKKESKVVYLAPVENSAQTNDIEYDPQTQVLDDFEIALNLLLQKPSTHLRKAPISTEIDHVVNIKEIQHHSAPTRLSRRIKSEILDFDIDLSSSDTDDDDSISSSNLPDSFYSHLKGSDTAEEFLENDLNLSELNLSDISSVDFILNEDENPPVHSNKKELRKGLKVNPVQVNERRYVEFLLAKKKEQSEDDLLIGKPEKASSKRRPKKSRKESETVKKELSQIESSEGFEKKLTSKPASRRSKQKKPSSNQPENDLNQTENRRRTKHDKKPRIHDSTDKSKGFEIKASDSKSKREIFDKNLKGVTNLSEDTDQQTLQRKQKNFKEPIKINNGNNREKSSSKDENIKSKKASRSKPRKKKENGKEEASQNVNEQ